MKPIKHKWLIILLCVLFFLGALTIYVNRVLFPTVVKKIAIEQAEAYLKRKVEIGSLHFNWLRGVVIDSVKVYQKDSQDVFVQAEKISIAMIFIPGSPKHKLILSSVNIQSPSIHLIHQGNNIWNFTDILNQPPGEPPPVDVSVSGIHISNGKVRLDNIKTSTVWTEIFNPINLSVGLGINGIGFKGSIEIPQKQGFLSVDGNYQPINQSLKTDLILKNIKPLDYLELSPVPLPVTLNSGVINEINTEIEYGQERIHVNGRWSLSAIDVVQDKQSLKLESLKAANADILINKGVIGVKGNLELSNLDVVAPGEQSLKLESLKAAGTDILVDKGVVGAKGKFEFHNVKAVTPALTARGSLTAQLDEFQMNSTEDISLKGTFNADNLLVALANQQSIAGKVDLKVLRGRLQKDNADVEGHVNLTSGVIILSENQIIKGDFKLDGLDVQRNAQGTSAKANVILNGLDAQLPGQSIKTNLKAPNLSVDLDVQNNVRVTSSLDLTALDAVIGSNSLKGDVRLKNLKVAFNPTQQVLDAQTQGVLQNALVHIDKQGNLRANAQFDVKATYPMTKPEDMQYSGSLSVADASFEGLPFGTIEKINMTADIKTNAVDIQNLALIALDTPIKASGRLSDFAALKLNVKVESERFDLSKIKTVAPDLLKAQGLSVDGETSFKLKFEGLMSDPLSGQFNANAVLKHVNVSSSVLKQDFKDISGALTADGSSLTWEDFTPIIMDKPFTSSGVINDFKNPKATINVEWNDLTAKAVISKMDDLVTIKSISGRYKTADFKTAGTVELGAQMTLNIKNDVNLKLEELSTLLPDLKASLEPLKLNGAISATASLSGTGNDWKAWTILADAHSDLVSVMGYKFNNVTLDIAQRSGKLEKLNLTSLLYDGQLNVFTTGDMTNDAIPFQTAVRVENVDLSKLKNDTGAKDEDLRGFIGLTTVVNGTVKDVLNLTGKGSLSVTQGYLMKKEFTSLFMIPELSNLIFTEASANFEIANQKVSTENFALKSEGAILNGKGSIGFDQSINMELHPEFNVDAIAQSESMRKGPSALIASAAGKYLTFTITGTLSKPQIRTIKRPGELIKKTGEILQENVGQILQGIFQ